ncbi:MAG: type I glyceraldehyde-3-phosphate dehydrogenase [Candidatus Kariarchaeaceae archaeon]|jgi:glyceraldehyde 3-phosphate dehydrogenase
MSKVKLGINGFGRIGRLVTRALLEMDKEVDIVAINDLSSSEMLAHLFEFDSIHGRFDGTVEVHENGSDLIFDGDRFEVLKERDPAKLPWKDYETDYVLECTGFFRNRVGLQKHIDAGAQRVILSAPAKPASGCDITLVIGVNHTDYDPAKHTLVSNASCTTNCLAPVVKVLDDSFGVEQGNMTTVHAYTNDQRILDSQHSDFRRARSGAMNMIPSSTGAAKAVGLVLPHLDGKIDGIAIRVPLPNVSLVDLTATVRTPTSIEAVQNAFQEAEQGYLKGILGTEWRSLVSSDFNHDPRSGIVDLPGLQVIDGTMVQVLCWYDNEYGFSNRLAELVHYMWDLENK